ncbi:DegT/DnrJ/EryC1/StrS family aminotransferase [Methanosarcina sp. KYL-1]|uniref:DegT/DnrJ/EryC1/StrS family aminotransferase n=1 Tax=Methanosarcina sp. KYL-1 TaxID=2602068 RepID=UPI002101A42E|nr:DegT/DnrJ/EryC1/StrS family aminotransferase [Methanosarcina sp. KYL-1]MCQ1535113.1 DegT/DnrJ/EryC1/StrS family aminotransferase [Methanosarcina sp. KYL-1]
MIGIAEPQIGVEEVEAVQGVLRSGILAQGPKVAEFEEAFAGYVGCEHAVAVNSGTAALHCALLAHRIGKGDEVVTTPFSFVASANSVLYTGAKPVFADIEPETFTLDTEKIQEKISSKTRAVLPVHLYGHPAGMKAILELAEDYGLTVIEDACQAHGAEYRGKKVGSLGTGAFSFYPTKNMTTGEGGMLTTDDREVAEKARLLRAHGSKARYLHDVLGYNLRMTDLSAAIGLVQLGKLDSFNACRQKNAEFLSRGFSGLPGIKTPSVKEGCTHVFHQYTVRVEQRNRLAAFLGEEGIGSGVHYPGTIPTQPLYEKLGYGDMLPEAERAAKEVLSLPVHPGVSGTDLEKIVETVTAFFTDK